MFLKLKLRPIWTKSSSTILGNPKSIRNKSSTSRKPIPKGEEGEAKVKEERFLVHPLALVSVLTIGYGLYWAMQQQKKGGIHYGKIQQNLEQTKLQLETSPNQLIFVIGEPCSGKTFLSKALAEKFNYKYLSTFDLLNQELEKPHTPHRSIILRSLREGVPVPLNTTIALLREAIQDNPNQSFVIDNFFRRMEHFLKFKDTLGNPDLVIEVNTDLEKLKSRFQLNYPYLNPMDLQLRLEPFQMSSYRNLIQFLDKNNLLLKLDGGVDLDKSIQLVKHRLNNLELEFQNH